MTAETKQADAIASAISAWRVNLTLAYMRANGYTYRHNWLLGPDGLKVCRGKDVLYRLRYADIWKWFWEGPRKKPISEAELEEILAEEAERHGFERVSGIMLARGSYQHMTMVTVSLYHAEDCRGQTLLALRVNKPYSAGTVAQAEEAELNVSVAKYFVEAVLKRIGGRCLPEVSRSLPKVA